MKSTVMGMKGRKGLKIGIAEHVEGTDSPVVVDVKVGISFGSQADFAGL